MRLLLACIDGLAWPFTDPPPFLNRVMDEGASGPLPGFPAGDRAWLINNEPLWPLLSRAGLRMGAMNLPGLWPAQPVNGFMVCRGGSKDPGGAWTHPPVLCNDLGDYVQPRPLPAAAPNWRSPLKDTAFAEAAALARMRYEHFRRLCESQKAQVGAIGWSALQSARFLFPNDPGREALMLAQLDAYLAWLHRELQPQALVVAGIVKEGQAGLLAILAPHMAPAGRIQDATWTRLMASLVLLAGLPAVAPDLFLAGGMPSGVLSS